MSAGPFSLSAMLDRSVTETTETILRIAGHRVETSYHQLQPHPGRDGQWNLAIKERLK
jgi:hypothetical protein